MKLIQFRPSLCLFLLAIFLYKYDGVTMLLVKGGNDFLRLLQPISGENPSPPLSNNVVTSTSANKQFLHIWGFRVSVHCYEDDISRTLERIQSQPWVYLDCCISYPVPRFKSVLLIPLIHFLSHQTEPVPQQEIRNKTWYFS